MDILEFTRKKVAEITGNTEQNTVPNQTQYTEDEVKQLSLDLIKKKRSELAYASIGENFFTDLHNDLQGLSVPSADNVPKTTGGYYSRPVADTSGVADIQQRLKSLSDAIQQVSYPVEKAEQNAKQAASGLETAATALTSAYETYKVTPTADTAQAYNQALSAYRKAKTGYDTAYGAYKTAYDQYQKVAKEADAAFSAWDKYVNDSNASYDAWRSTIRDADVIKQELDVVEAQIKKLEPINSGTMSIINWLGNAAANAAASSSSLGPAPSAAGAESPEMAKLKAQRELLQEEYDWAVYSGLTDIRNTPDFGEMSKQDRLMLIDMTEIFNMPEEDQQAFAQWVYYRGWDAPPEVQALEMKYTKERLEELESSQRRYQNYLETKDTKDKAQEGAQGFWGGLGSTLLRIPVSIGNAITSPFAVAQELLWYDDRYGNLDPNAPGFQGNIWASTVNDTVSKSIAGDEYDENGEQVKDGGWFRQGLSTVYGAATSAADNLARMAVAAGITAVTGGSAAPITLGLAAMGSFGDTVQQISSQGGDPVQALAMGVISGGLEVLTEKYSVENILEVAKGDPLNFKKTLKEMLKQGAIEVSEEEINFLASTFAEAAVMGDKSSYNLEVKKLMEKGLSENEAKHHASLSLIREAAETAVQSFLSGGMMTGVVNTANSIRYSSFGQKLGLGDLTLKQAREIIESGLESAEDTKAHQMALKLQEKIEAGKMPTKGELAQQLMANAQAIQAEQNTGEDANTGIKEQLKSSEKILAGMEPVASITTPSNFAEMDINAKKNWVIEKLRPTGYSVERKGFGIIDFAQKKLRAAFNYFKKGSADEAAFEALPYVLEKGVEISSRENHKGRKYSTVTFAAPVTINGQRGNMAVVVRQTQGNQYKVHRVLLPDGSAFYISETENEAESSTTRGVADTGSLASSKDTASTDIIDQGGGIVNPNIQNGGTENASTYEQSDTPSTGTGAGVLHGSGQRNVGAGTGEQTGSLDSSTETAVQRTERLTGASRIKAAVARQNLARSLRLPKVNAQDIGITKGTETRKLQVLPQEHWDDELQALAQKIQEETGREAVFVVGEIYIQGEDRKNHRIRAAITDKQVILQADYTKVPLEQILDHEIYHYKAALVRKKNHNLDNMNKLSILERFSKEEFQAVLDVYIAALDGQYGLSEAVERNDNEAYRKILALIQQEMLADAYAGINAFGAGADKFTKAVNDRMEELNPGKKTAQENGVRQTNGPNENTVHLDGEWYSADAMQRTIYPGMDDAQRTDILMNKEIYAPIYDSTHPVTGAQILKLKGMYVTEARSLLTEIARQCGDFQSDLHNADIDLSFAYSNKSLKESVNKQSKRGSGAESFGKMLTVLPEICETAVEIEAHTDRYVDTARADGNLKEMHILVGAFMDGNDCIPVQLEIKEYIPEAGLKNKLYVTVTMKNEAGVTPRISNANVASENARSRPASIISLAELVANVKDDTGGLVKYLPDQMLTEDQQKAKQQALTEDETRIGDMRYAYAVEQGNTQAVQRMLKDKAEQAGYSASNDWRMAHRAPNRNSGVTIDNADEMYGGDGSIRSPLAHQYYGEGRAYDIKAIVALSRAWRDPEGSITVYRAVPTDVKDNRLRNGDWVSPTREYAQEHGERYFEKGFRILEQEVPVKHLYIDGNSIHEFGYDNGRDTEVYKNTRNNVKLAEVTYDDEGNVIPLSERFDATNKDIRYSTDDSEGAKKWTPKTDAEYLMDEAEFRRIRSEVESRDKQWRDNFLYNELGEEGAERYKATQKMLADREKAERAQRAKENRIQTGDVELDVESRATEAKRLLENKLLKTFSIPDGMRGELRAYIGGFADRIVKHGALTEDDRRRFFTRMYESGAVTIPADDYYGEARSYIKGGHIYVPGRVVAEFGGDWQDVRRRAFAAGIYLTYERTDKNGHSVSGIDVWNSDLAADLPGLFDAEDTDETEILQKIIHVAEQGKDEKISLAEYVARVARDEYTSEDDVLDSLERQMTWALKSFAETAKVEIQLKDRNLRRVLKERQENMERAQRAKERRELQELQQKTLKSLQWLNKNRRLAPEDLREEWNRALSDIDLYAVGAANEMNWSNKYQATWKDLAEMYKEARAKDPNFHEDKEIERIISRLDDQKIADMDPAALLDLYKLATGLRTAFYNRNNVINDEQFRIFDEMYSDVKEELTEAGKRSKGAAAIADRLFSLEQLSAMNVLERMAGWNPNSAWYSMARQLERGEREVRAFTVKANRMLEDFLNEHKDWVMNADGQGKDAIWYTIEVPELMEWGEGNKPIFGDTFTVYMTPAQKVHMYLESKNLDNLRHMEGGRTFVVDKELYGQGKRQEALATGRTVRLAPETVKQLVSDLTEEEMELAKVLDQYYNGFATGEINRVSNILYGYDKAMGKHYAPIYTNQNYTNAEFGVFDTTAEGVGNLKGRVQYSKNPSYNISAFDAFERNMSQTARFVGMAIPLRNWTTLMNWQGSKNSTKDVIDHAWGLDYHKYISDLLTDLQGGKIEQQDIVNEAAEKLLSNYISSVFGANPGIVLKQLGSIPLAGAYLGVGNVVPGRTQVERLDSSLIAKYTQDLAWRSLGYSMPETKQLKDHPNWTQNNKVVRFAIGGGAITAMDTWAAGVLWPWAENKVRKEHPELEIGTQEQINNGESPFYKKVAEEFENAVARSQSTSDQMHQGRLRKSKSTMTRMFTMFTSDSAQTYNTLRQLIGEAGYYQKSGQEKKYGTIKRAVGTAALALILNALWGEGVNLLAAIIKNKGKRYRDDEGEITAVSVLEQMMMGMVSSISGTVIGGDTLAELIGSKFTGEKFYGPESMEVSVFQDMWATLDAATTNFAKLITDVADVVWNGGDVGEYLRQNWQNMLGQVKDTVLEVASYWGIPAANLEAWIIGAMKFIPGFGAVYDGLFESAKKSSLGGLTGSNLEIRAGSLLNLRGVDASDETADALAALYEAGYRGAIPSNVPAKVTIDEEEHTLNVAQRQLYGKVWADVVSGALDTITASDKFAEASPEIREGMLKRLYSYASEQAKASMFDDYEPGDTKEEISAYEQAGLDVADYFAVKATGYNTDRYLKAVLNGLPEEESDALMEGIDDLEPMAGEDQVANVQKWRTCVDMYRNPQFQLAALGAYMTPEQFKKAKVADQFDISLSSYVKLFEIRAEYDENKNGSFSNAEYKKAIDSLHLSTRDSAVLWQLFAGTKSAKNNPYSATVGQKILDALAE